MVTRDDSGWAGSPGPWAYSRNQKPPKAAARIDLQLAIGFILMKLGESIDSG